MKVAGDSTTPRCTYISADGKLHICIRLVDGVEYVYHHKTHQV